MRPKKLELVEMFVSRNIRVLQEKKRCDGGERKYWTQEHPKFVLRGEKESFLRENFFNLT